MVYSQFCNGERTLDKCFAIWLVAVPVLETIGRSGKSLMLPFFPILCSLAVPYNFPGEEQYW